MRGPLWDDRGGFQFAVYGRDGWLYTHSLPGESVTTCRARAKEWTDRVAKEQTNMHTYHRTGHYVSEDAARRRYEQEGGGDVDLALKEGRIKIGPPPARPGETLEVREGRYHYVVPDKVGPAKGKTADPDVQAVLRRCRLEGTDLYVPPERLDPKHFAKVKKEIVIWGGKWSTPKQCFVFAKDPSQKIAHFLDTGEIINEKKDRQAFYTPPAVVEIMLEHACIDDGSVVLEPSAGGGAIARACVKAGAKEVVCCEIDPCECAALRTEGIYAEVHEGDFLRMELGREFNVIAMNPPFTRGQDSRHVLHAHKFLRRNGRLLAIVADKDDPKLAHLKPETIERIPAGAFKESGTNVAPRIIQILA